jgi:hypothetical protein
MVTFSLPWEEPRLWKLRFEFAFRSAKKIKEEHHVERSKLPLERASQSPKLAAFDGVEQRLLAHSFG